MFWFVGVSCGGVCSARGAARTQPVFPLAVTLYSRCSRWFLRSASWRRALRGSPAWRAGTSAPPTPSMKTSQFLPNRSNSKPQIKQIKCVRHDARCSDPVFVSKLHTRSCPLVPTNPDVCCCFRSEQKSLYFHQIQSWTIW